MPYKDREVAIHTAGAEAMRKAAKSFDASCIGVRRFGALDPICKACDRTTPRYNPREEWITPALLDRQCSNLRAKTPERLADDIARCDGIGSDEEGWREGCDVCLRRVSPVIDSSRVWKMEPPELLIFFCPYVIDPDKK